MILFLHMSRANRIAMASIGIPPGTAELLIYLKKNTIEIQAKITARHAFRRAFVLSVGLINNTEVQITNAAHNTTNRGSQS
ncbi:unnamed protein product [marine sediment metagenome]|uniref:Uncharacterized protein n=1 Tax=marine sediment metagenome TaxID=412755 RepID=X1PUF0_9ZZZZ